MVKRLAQQLNLALLPAIALLAFCIMPSSVLGQEEEIRGKSPGFRTDFGFYLMGGGHSCAGGGSEFSECTGNGGAWATHLGLAGGVVVRPFRFFSMGLDLAFTNLVPMKDAGYDAYKRFSDLTFSSILRVHVPIRIKKIMLEPAIGMVIGFVNSYVPRRSEAMSSVDDTNTSSNVEDQIPGSSPIKYRLFGPALGGLISLNLFVLPKLGFGFEMRILGNLYQEVCEDFATGETYCRGFNQDDDDSDLDKYPMRLFYGLHFIYYI